jgi:hypothetical protein
MSITRDEIVEREREEWEKKTPRAVRLAADGAALDIGRNEVENRSEPQDHCPVQRPGIQRAVWSVAH